MRLRLMPQALFCRLLQLTDRLMLRLCRIPLWVLTPLIYNASPCLKGLKPTKEEALPPVFYIRRLKTDGKIEPAAQGNAL